MHRRIRQNLNETKMANNFDYFEKMREPLLIDSQIKIAYQYRKHRRLAELKRIEEAKENEKKQKQNRK